MYLRLLIQVSIIIGISSVMLSYFLGDPIESVRLYLHSGYELTKELYESVAQIVFNKNAGSTELHDRMLTASMLSQFVGTNGNSIYVAFLGKVYNVDRGAKHYGPGKGYNFFAGRDASRAFVTGDFTEKGLTDKVIDLGANEMLEVKHWIDFYENDYHYVGKLIGRYYDESGEATMEQKRVMTAIDKAEEWNQRNDVERRAFPPCNSEWKSETGGRVWCTKLSGGVNRNWEGVPRKFRNPATGQIRCACVRISGTRTGWDGSTRAEHPNRGDLDNPNLGLYDDCDPASKSCKIIE